MPQILRLFLLNARIVLISNNESENSIYNAETRASKNSKKAPKIHETVNYGIHGFLMPFYWFWICEACVRQDTKNRNRWKGIVFPWMRSLQIAKRCRDRSGNISPWWHLSLIPFHQSQKSLQNPWLKPCDDSIRIIS